MIFDKYKISSESIRRTNRNLIERGVNIQAVSYNGVITTKILVNGKTRIHLITDSEIRESYSKSLDLHAEKI
jgi:hypothetical protein